MTYDEFYISTYTDDCPNNDLVILRNDFRSYCDRTKFDTFLNELEQKLPELVAEYGRVDASLDCKMVGYAMKDSWKFDLINEVFTPMNVNEMEIYIGELGIRRAFRYAYDCGFGDDEDLKLYEESGLRQLFYKVIYHSLDLNYNVEMIDYEKDYDLQMGRKDDDDDDDVCGVAIDAFVFAKMTFAEQKAWIKSQDPNRKDIVCPIDFNKKTCDELRKCLRDIFADVNEEDKKRNLRGVGKMKKEMLVSECERWTEYLMTDKGKAEFKQLKENK
jgi:hypothetical protein